MLDRLYRKDMQPTATPRARGGLHTLYSFMLIAILVITSACGPSVGSIGSILDRETQKTINALNDGILALGNASADWQSVLQDTLAKLTDAAQATIRNDIQDVLQNAIAAAGTQFSCRVDFFRNRAREELLRIRAKLLKHPFPDPQPVVCNPVPEIIDASRVQSNDLKAVLYYGYDFDSQPGVQAFLEDSSGKLTDVTQKALDHPSNYILSLNLGSNGVPLTAASQRIHIKWGNTDLSTVAVAQTQTPICQSKVLDVPQPPPLTVTPALTQGDANFGSSPVRVWANGYLSYAASVVNVVLDIDFVEQGGDHTSASSWQTTRIYAPDSGWAIDQVTGIGGHTSVNYTHQRSAGDYDPQDGGSDGPVRRFEFMGFNGSNAAGSTTRAVVTFNTFHVLLHQTGNCVSPTAVQSAKNMHALSPTLLQHFDTQMKLLHPDVLKLVAP